MIKPLSKVRIVAMTNADEERYELTPSDVAAGFATGQEHTVVRVTDQLVTVSRGADSDWAFFPEQVEEVE